MLAQATSNRLPSPLLPTRLLLEDPLLLTAFLIVAAVVVFFILNAKGRVKLAALYGGVGLLLAAGIQILAYAVVTDRETIIAATTPLVQATAAADAARLDTMLDGEVKLTNDLSLAAGELPHGESWDKAKILLQVRQFLGEQWRLKECAVLEVQGVIDQPGRGRTQVRIRATPDVTDFPMLSTWRIDWKQARDGGWLVIGIQPIDLGQLNKFR